MTEPTDKSMSTQPTDAELDALWRFEASKNWDSTLAMRTSYARAVLAKWVTPTPVEQEPVAQLWVSRFETDVKVLPAAHDVMPYGAHLLYLIATNVIK